MTAADKRGIGFAIGMSLPLDEFVTKTQAILAKKGSGKSYTASVQAEELLELRQQVVAIDPTGAWWGLRSPAPGTRAGYPIAVLGGEHGDVPLEVTAGEVIADAIASEHFSAILDLSLFRKGELRQFMTAFLETLYRRNREAMHLFIDEADVVAPQKPMGDEARLLGACEDIVRRGRIRGIGCTLITQRPQVLNKNVLSQVDMLTALRMNHPKDLGAIREWVDVHGVEADAKRMIADLPALPIGEAWVWAPATDLFQRVKIRERYSFDSGRTPKHGERVAPPKTFAAVDIAKLGAAITATVERAKDNDPKALRAKVAELEKDVTRMKAAALERPTAKALPPKVVEKPVITDAQLARIEKLVIGAGEMTARASEISDRAKTIVDGLRAAVSMVRAPAPAPARLVPVMPEPPPFRSAPAPVITRRTVRADPTLPQGEALTLAALIQYPNGLLRTQIRAITGRKRSSSDSYISRLRARGFVANDADPDRITATDAGRIALPDAEPLPQGRALQAYWLERLSGGERVVLEHLIGQHGQPMARDALDDATGYKRSSRDSYISRLAARELVVDVGRGMVRAASALFEAP